MTLRSRLIYLSSMCVLAACAARPERVQPHVEPLDPLRVVRYGGDRVSSLRALFRARFSRGDTSEHVRGVLLVDRPAHFRMRLSSLLGFTVLDYTSNAGNDRLWLASSERVLVGDEIDRSGFFSQDAARWIFLRTGAVSSADCTADGGEEAIVECTDGNEQYRGHVQRASGLLTREEVFVGGKTRLIVGYDDYRQTDGVRLPYAIDWTEPSSGARIEIRIDRYEVDPRLAPELFAPTSGAD